MAQINKTFINQLRLLSDDELDTMASSSPGMTNIYIRAEVERRKKEKDKEQENKPVGMDYSNSMK
jgi:hypothetical protein